MGNAGVMTWGRRRGGRGGGTTHRDEDQRVTRERCEDAEVGQGQGVTGMTRGHRGRDVGAGHGDIGGRTR